MLFKTNCNYDLCITGLGNPGIQYDGTRHNAGFDAVEYIADKYGIEINKHRFKAVFGDGKINGKRVLLVKPQTFMNLSGEALRPLADFYKIPYDRIAVLSDDVSLPVGKLRIRKKGSAGGHNGLKSIIQMLGTEEFIRIRLGVGEKPRPDYDLAEWVLGKIPKDEKTAFDTALQKACLSVEEILASGVDNAMNKYNG